MQNGNACTMNNMRCGCMSMPDKGFLVCVAGHSIKRRLFKCSLASLLYSLYETTYFFNELSASFFGAANVSFNADARSPNLSSTGLQCMHYHVS